MPGPTCHHSLPAAICRVLCIAISTTCTALAITYPAALNTAVGPCVPSVLRSISLRVVSPVLASASLRANSIGLNASGSGSESVACGAPGGATGYLFTFLGIGIILRHWGTCFCTTGHCLNYVAYAGCSGCTIYRIQSSDTHYCCSLCRYV